MAEGLIEGLLGSEPEEEDLAAEIGVDSADRTARALALEHGGKDPVLTAKTALFLDKQSRMLDIQMEHLHEQRGLNLKHMRVRRWRETLQLGTQVFIALGAGVIGLGVAVMLYDAFTSRAVVVDAFGAPSALAGRGVTGDVVAAGVLDTLQKLQYATRSPTAGLNTHGAWAGDVKIKVPETGVSIGEINRLLHERFGHDLHIDGDLVQTDTGAWR